MVTIHKIATSVTGNGNWASTYYFVYQDAINMEGFKVYKEDGEFKVLI